MRTDIPQSFEGINTSMKRIYNNIAERLDGAEEENMLSKHTIGCWGGGIKEETGP